MLSGALIAGDTSASWNSSLFHFDICFGCLKEPSHRDSSFEHTHNIGFGREVRKLIFVTHSSLKACYIGINSAMDTNSFYILVLP